MTAVPLRPVLILAGPTASGKSALALGLAERFAGTVINADSMQVYRELAVLTARPDAAALARAPHRLYGFLSVRETCSAGRWRGLALAEIAAAHGAGRLPIVTGGTGLYLRALTRGIAAIPDIPPEVRAATRALLAEIGPAALHARLAARDPAGAARLRPSDPQRIARAFEVAAATGRTLAEWQAEAPPPPALRFATILVLPPRAALYAACDARFARMLALGALDEAAALAALGLDPALPAMKALGVAPLLAHLQGEITLAEAADRARRDTRRFAKRQLTWFRHQLRPDLMLPVQDEQFLEREPDKIFPFISTFLLTGPG